MIWIYSVLKKGVHPGSAGQGITRKCHNHRPASRGRNTDSHKTPRTQLTLLFCGALTISADPDQTSQNVASVQGLHCVPTECSMKLRIKMKKTPPKNPYNGNGLVQLIPIGNSIRLKWVKTKQPMLSSSAR